MKTWFDKASAVPLTAAEQSLKSLGIKYKRKRDGSLHVSGDLDMSSKGLTRLPDFSNVTVGGDFICYVNQLTSLEGAPQVIGGSFYCSCNRLTSLEHAPQSVGERFLCHGNRLTSLEGAPQAFKELTSDFGTFFSWGQVPEDVRSSPETKARQKQECLEQAIRASTVLQEPVKLASPLRFKTGCPK